MNNHNENAQQGVVLKQRSNSKDKKKVNPIVKAVTSKLVSRPKENRQLGSENKTNLPTIQELAVVLRDTIQAANDAEAALDTLPDLELVAQVAISSILSSNDLITTTINYDVTTNELPLELKNKLLKVVSNYFDDEYKLSSYLYDILYDVMFKTGSYAIAIMPESSIDQVINGKRNVAKEDINSFLRDVRSYRGILGSVHEQSESSQVALEDLIGSKQPKQSEGELTIAFESEDYGKIKLTDNPTVMRNTDLRRIIASQRAASPYDTVSRVVAMEEYGLLNDKDHKSFYDDSPRKTKQIDEIPAAIDTKQPNVGHPLVQHYPSESVVTVHVPGDPSSHVGYLILLDSAGNPVNRKDMLNSQMMWGWARSDGSSNALGQIASGLGLQGSGEGNRDWTLASLTNSYSELVERKVTNSIKNGLYGDSVAVAKPEEVYRIMLARTLAKQNTQVLYIPAEQFVYFALDYNDYGIGRSLTDKNRTVITGRAALMYATLQSSILNASRNMTYNITLDPEDREAEKTVDDIKDSIYRQYNAKMPFRGTITDMEAFASNAGLSFNIEGNQYYPSTNVSASDETPDYKVPDRNTIEDFAKMNYRGYGVDPDLIFSPGDIEFATQVQSKDLLSTKQVCKRQEKLNPILSHFCRTYTISSGILIGKLVEEIKTYYSDSKEKLNQGIVGKTINEFVSNLDVTLPPPDMSMVSSQMESFDSEERAIDKMVEIFVDEAMIESANIEIRSRDAQDMFKNYFKRMWFRNNGVLSDFIAHFDDEDLRQEVVKEFGDDAVKIMKAVGMSIKRSSGRIETIKDKITAPVDESGNVIEDDTGDDMDDGTDDGMDDGLGEDTDTDTETPEGEEDTGDESEENKDDSDGFDLGGFNL